MAGKIPNAQQIAAQRARRKVKKVVNEGIASRSRFLLTVNTIITITDRQGNAIAASSSGAQGFQRVLESPLRSPLHRLLQNKPDVMLLNTVLKNVEVRITRTGTRP